MHTTHSTSGFALRLWHKFDMACFAFVHTVPSLLLAVYWLVGETALVIAVLCSQIAMLSIMYARKRAEADGVEGRGGAMIARDKFEQRTKVLLESARTDSQKAAVFFVRVDDYDELLDRYGSSALDELHAQIARRLQITLRERDLIGWSGGSDYFATTYPQATLDLETGLQISGRIMRALEEPYAIDGSKIFVSACVGFCLLGREIASLDQPNRDATSVCAKMALDVACASAPAAIRAFTPDMQKRSRPIQQRENDAVEALAAGEIVPWFQPQISTDTGRITGFEALARWMHPRRGALAPAEFLPQIEAADQMRRLSETMVYNAMTAIKAWDQAGLDIAQVGVNFSASELNDPATAERIRWELDRFELSAERLAVEILETVVAQSPDDVVTRNIQELQKLGCRIDLDDFGTGHASLISIRRFGVSRIKIDRSFVIKADRDPEQQRMIKAILTMAEKLEIETLAEGVETVGEHALLAQLGCTYVQGFGIGRPMPFDRTMTWIRNHNDKLQAPPKIGGAHRRHQ